MDDLIECEIVYWDRTIDGYGQEIPCYKHRAYVDLELIIYMHDSRMQNCIDVGYASGDTITIEYDLDLFAKKYSQWKKDRASFKMINSAPN